MIPTAVVIDIAGIIKCVINAGAFIKITAVVEQAHEVNNIIDSYLHMFAFMM
jgi:hypothetical protein